MGKSSSSRGLQPDVLYTYFRGADNHGMHAQAADNAVGITILGEYHGLIGVPVSQTVFFYLLP